MLSWYHDQIHFVLMNILPNFITFCSFTFASLVPSFKCCLSYDAQFPSNKRNINSYSKINMKVYSTCMRWVLFSSLAIIGAVAVTDEAVTDKEPYLRGGELGSLGSDPCSGAGTVVELPFAVTNIAVRDIGGGQVNYNFRSTGSPDSLHYLKDLRLCDDFNCSWKPYQIVATEVTQSEFKSAVSAKLSNLGINRVFYNIHGYKADPKGSLEGAKSFDTDDYLVIPIQWRTRWVQVVPRTTLTGIGLHRKLDCNSQMLLISSQTWTMNCQL